jgi:hypothetical protein
MAAKDKFGVGYEIKDMFFDRVKVERLISRDGAKFLNKVGAFIRITARRSMRSGGKKRKPSQPGMPPRYHTKHDVATLRNILYGYDASRQSVIVGPVKLNKKQYLGGKLSAGTIPALHEFGGTAGIRERKTPFGKWVPVGRKNRGGATRVRTARYPARPFMAPALAKAQERFPVLWYGSVSAA